MELNNAVSQIKDINTKSEAIFLQLGNLFPSLLNREGGTAIQTLSNMLSGFNRNDAASTNKEKELFTDYGAKYNPLFDKLNEKIEDLGKLDTMIAEIKEDSEQMELIALNAMVISIKSGEKGQAFSRITENLQRLSNDMFLFSDKLSEEESQLLNFINTLKQIFSGILDSQKNLASKGSTGSADIKSLISNIHYPLSKMEESIESIYPPIQKAMEGLQLQDMIRQALDHVQKCIEEIKKSPKPLSGSDEELDYISFNIELYELAAQVLTDINSYVSKSYSVFDSNWQKVIQILDDVENSKNDFERRFLSDYSIGTENLEKKLTALIDNFQMMMNEFNNYHLVQKDLLHTCQNITARARTIYSVFDNLRPVMSRLHHVRILQQIEVSKNDAIKSVQDSVTDMDNLINSANKSLDTMQALLESFIQDTGSMLSTFTSSISKDNDNMVALKTEKSKFFDELKLGRDNLATIIQNFTVFPEGFQSKCVTVQQNLQDLGRIESQIRDFINDLKQEQRSLNDKKSSLMRSRGIMTWNIKNNQFSNLIKNFTITAHKEVAGKIGGFDIEKGSPAGEITFF